MDYSSNVILDENRERIQSLYASQLYGTFFGIFGKFIVKPWKDNYKLIEKIHLMLINFKGHINLEVRPDFVIAGFEQKVRNEPDIKGLGITLPVQHTLNSKPIQGPVILDFKEVTHQQDPNNIVVTDSHGNKLGVKVLEGEYLRLERKLMGMNPSASTSDEGSSPDGVFDSEFYRRDGIFYEPVQPLDMDTAMKYDLGDGSFASPSCVPSNSKIIFENSLGIPKAE